METEEMKKQNEEILKKWRGLGLLAGLKEGSINEWRCAKSFDNTANYILDNEYESYSLPVFAFPFVRKVLCTGKKRMHRILTGEEVCAFLMSVTIDECLNYCRGKVRGEIGKTLLKLIENYIKYAERFEPIKEMSIIDFFDGLKDGHNYHGEVFTELTKGVFDFEAELLAAATDIFVENNTNEKKEG